MPEPVNRWQPVTDFYIEEATKTPDVEAANEQIRQELNEEKVKQIVPEKKAPLGIRIFIWYCFGRAGFYALLLFLLASFPHSGFSNWLFDGVANFLHMPGSKNYQDAREQQIEKIAREHNIPENVIRDNPYLDEQPQVGAGELRNLVMLYLLAMLALTTWIGFMWWNHSWKVRWITMCYSGGMVAKALINFIAGAASGVGSGLDPVQMPLLMGTIAVNTFVFLYLAFGHGVKQWFEEVG